MERLSDYPDFRSTLGGRRLGALRRYPQRERVSIGHLRPAVHAVDMDPWARAYELAAKQLGLLDVRQALDVGIPSSTLYDYADRRGWDQVHTRVLALPGLPWTWEREAAAAALSLSPRALLSRRSAAYVWDLLEEAPRPIELVVPAERRIIAPRGSIVWRSATLRRQDRVLAGGLPVTSVSRTLCDLAAVLDADELTETIAVAVQRRLVTLDNVARRAEAMARFRGCAHVRDAVAALAGRRTDSTVERRFFKGLTAAGIPPDRTQYPVYDARGRLIAVLDMAYLAEKVDVEVNGLAFHGTPAQQLEDDGRRNALQELDWITVVVPASLVLRNMARAVETVRRMVLKRRHERQTGA